MHAQRQGHLRGGICGCPVDRNVVEAELLCTAASNVLERERGGAEITRSGGVDLMPRRHAVPHVRLEHRVMAHASELDALTQQYVTVVLQPMPDLAALSIL